MRPAKASAMITDAYNMGTAKSLASRVQRDIQELRIIVPSVAGDSADRTLEVLSDSISSLLSRLDRIQIDDMKRRDLR